MRTEFISSLDKHLEVFSQRLDGDVIDKLADYFELVMEHNPILHLVGPCSPAEFATRHILESLTLLEYLPPNAAFADVGTGGGLPSIPCLLARTDLTAVLIESKEKKAKFLETAVVSLGIADRATVANKQFAEVDLTGFSHITCRALDKFSEKLPQLIRWSKGRHLLIFGNKSLSEKMQASGISVAERLLPLSEQRYLLASLAK